MYGHSRRPPPTFNDRGEPVPPVSPKSSSIYFIGSCSPNEKTSGELHYSYDTKSIDDTANKYANMFIKDGKFLRMLYDHENGRHAGHILMTYRNKSGDMCVVGELTNATEGGRTAIAGVATHDALGLSSGLSHRVNKTYVAEIPFQETTGHSLEEVSVTPNPCYKKTTWIKYYSDNIGDIIKTLGELASTGSGDSTVDVQTLPNQLASLPAIVNRQGAKGNIFSAAGENGDSPNRESTFASQRYGGKNGGNGGSANGRIPTLSVLRSFFTHLEHHGKTGSTQGIDQFFTRDPRARSNPNFPGSYISSYSIRTKHSATGAEPIWLGTSDDDTNDYDSVGDVSDSGVIARLDKLLHIRSSSSSSEPKEAAAVVLPNFSSISTEVASTIARMNGLGSFSVVPGSVNPSATPQLAGTALGAAGAGGVSAGANGAPAGAGVLPPSAGGTGGGAGTNMQGLTVEQQAQFIHLSVQMGQISPIVGERMLAAIGASSPQLQQAVEAQQQQQQQQFNPSLGPRSIMTPAQSQIPTPSSFDMPAGSGISNLYTDADMKERLARDHDEQVKAAAEKKAQEDAKVKYDVLMAAIEKAPALASDATIVAKLAELAPLLPKQVAQSPKLFPSQQQSQQVPQSASSPQSLSPVVAQAPAQQAFVPPAAPSAQANPAVVGGGVVNTSASAGAPPAQQPQPPQQQQQQPAQGPLPPHAAPVTPSATGVTVNVTPNRGALEGAAQASAPTTEELLKFMREVGDKKPEALAYMASLYEDALTQGLDTPEKYAANKGITQARLAVANRYDEVVKERLAEKAKLENDKKVLAQNEIFVAAGENQLSLVNKHLHEKGAPETLKYLADFRAAKTNPNIVLGPQDLDRITKIVTTASAEIASQSDKERETQRRNAAAYSIAATHRFTTDKAEQTRIQELARLGLGPDGKPFPTSGSAQQQPQQANQPLASGVSTNASAAQTPGPAATPAGAADAVVSTNANAGSRPDSMQQQQQQQHFNPLAGAWDRSDDGYGSPLSIFQLSTGFNKGFDHIGGRHFAAGGSSSGWTSTRASASEAPSRDEINVHEKLQSQMRGGGGGGAGTSGPSSNGPTQAPYVGDTYESSTGRSFTVDEYERTIASGGAPPPPGMNGMPPSEDMERSAVVEGAELRFKSLISSPDLMFDRITPSQLLAHVKGPRSGMRAKIQLVDQSDNPLNLYGEMTSRVLTAGPGLM